MRSNHKSLWSLLTGSVILLEPLPVYVTTRDDSLIDTLYQCNVFAQLTIQPHQASAPPPNDPGVWLRDFDDSSTATLSVFCYQMTKHPHLAALAVVRRLHSGAFAYTLHHGIDALLTKPLVTDTLQDTLLRLAAQLPRRLRRHQLATLLEPLMAQLTFKERAVLEGLRLGQAIKVLAHHLQLSEKTISMYRSRLMQRFDVQNSIQLAFCASWWHLYCQKQLV